MLIFSTCCSTLLVENAAATSCDDVKIVFARGSGESLNDQSYQAWRQSIDHSLRSSTLRYSHYELGSTAQSGFQYPAVSVSGSFSGFGRLVSAYVSGGEAFQFGDSVARGSAELKNYIRNVHAMCPNTKFVLGGYSQGAMVLSRTLGELDADRIVYVATFGDPKLYLPEGKGLIPPACLGQSYSEYRANVADCRAYEGVLGSYQPYQPDGYHDKLGTWCNAADIMCSSGASIDDHTSYVSEQLYSEAARKIKTRLKKEFPTAFTSSQQNNPLRNLAFLIDTSSSMEPVLEHYKELIADLANQVLQADGEVALAEYRDLDDPFAPRIISDFGEDKIALDEKLSAVTSDNGGDDPESALSALLYTMNNLSWQPGATKSIILLTDASYLDPDRDGTKLPEVVQRSLEIDPVNVYVVAAGYLADYYADLVEYTNGQFFNVYNLAGWTDVETAIMERPEANLAASEYLGCIGDEFLFDASNSATASTGTLQYSWDLDGDGNFEITNGPSAIRKTYTSANNLYIQVKVTDEQGLASTMSAHVRVLSTMSSLPEIFTAQAVLSSEGNYEITFQTNADRVLLAIDDAPIGYIDAAQGGITLGDLSSDAVVQLIPYSYTSGRGTPISLNLAMTEQLIIPKAPNTGILY